MRCIYLEETQLELQVRVNLELDLRPIFFGDLQVLINLSSRSDKMFALKMNSIIKTRPRTDLHTEPKSTMD